MSASLPLTEDTGNSLPLHLVRAGDEQALQTLCGDAWAFLRAQGFTGRAGTFTLLPGSLHAGESAPVGAVFCYDSSSNSGRSSGPLPFGALAQLLPSGPWALQTHEENAEQERALLNDAVLGFCLGSYRFRLSEQPRSTDEDARLVKPESLTSETEILARAFWLGRDLVNMPANLLGPLDLAETACAALKARGAEAEIIGGSALEAAYPCLAAAGAGSDRAPVVLVGRWGKGGRRKLSLVGKGVCFDTGGYDLKPSASMRRMKKDMGGAALMLALACALIEIDAALDLEIRLGCIENSVSGHAMRPGDVLQTRQGLTVEVGNTDAEGRLVLCDLLTEAAEAAPDLLLDASTLTGAARVALGPDLPALFANDEALAESLLKAGKEAHDPLWRLPLWDEYDAWLESPIADCSNLSSQPMAGAVTAALFLKKFVPDSQKWAHIDTYSWNDTARPGRPLGGEMLALRALFKAFS